MRIDIGYMLSENEMMTMFSSEKHAVGFSMNLIRKNIHLDFYIDFPEKNKPHDLGYHRLQLKLDHLSQIFVEHYDSHEVLVIPMNVPPEMYRKSAEIESTHGQSSN